jgi:hypothetical protein
MRRNDTSDRSGLATHLIKGAALFEHDAPDGGRAGWVESLTRVAGVVGLEVEVGARQLRGRQTATERHAQTQVGCRAKGAKRRRSRERRTRSGLPGDRWARAEEDELGTHTCRGLVVERRRQPGVLAEEPLPAEEGHEVVRDELVAVEGPDDEEEDGERA